MIKKTISFILAIFLTTSLISVEANANTNNINEKLKVLQKFTLNQSVNSKEKDTTLGELIKNRNFKDVVIHNAPSNGASNGIRANISNLPVYNESLREGNLNNIVVNVKFKGENEYLATNKYGQPIKEVFNNLYNTSNTSVKEYYDTVSNNKLNVETSFIGQDVDNSIELDNTRGYYRPYSRENREGYFDRVVVDINTAEFIANVYVDDVEEDLDPSDGVVSIEYVYNNMDDVALLYSLDIIYRELSLMDEISRKANDSGIVNLNLDKDNNELIDALTVMVGVPEGEGIANDLGWAELLWPHQTEVIRDITQEDVDEIKSIMNLDFSFALDAEYELANKYIGKYNLYTSDFILPDELYVNSDKGKIGAIGVVAHELAHTLDFPDFYNYLNQYDPCVGQWDLMANTGIVPQYVNSYLRKEAGWLSDEELPEIKADGEYELKPVSSTSSGDITGYTIQLPEYPEQLFFVEYRKSEGLFDGGQFTLEGMQSSIKTIESEDSGLLIYRVDNSVVNDWNMLMAGNFNGYPYNLYAFRPDSDNSDLNNSNAALNGTTKRKFGSINSNEILNSITFQDGIDDNFEPKLVNSRVVIDNVSVDEDNNSIKFTVDAKDPSIINAEFVDGKVIVQLDEKIDANSNLELIKFIKGTEEQEITSQIVENKIEISLKNGKMNGEYTLNIPSDAIKDVVGKTLIESYSTNLSVNNPTTVDSVTLDKTELSLNIGEEAQLLANIAPEDATNKGVTWTSSEESIVTVDTNGKIKAIAEGTATVTVTTKDGNKVASCEVTVNKKSDNDKVVTVSKIENPNGKNEVVIPEGAKPIVEITDIEAIKSGNGSLIVKQGNNTIEIPLSAVDANMVKENSKLVFTFNTLTDSTLTKGFKGVNKVFEFTLTLVTGSESVIIHKFNNGDANITLALTDDELKGLDKSKLSMFYYNEATNKYEAMETTVNGNNVTFKTPHFSKFILAEKVDANPTTPAASTNVVLTQGPAKQNLPQTGGLNSIYLIFAGLALVASGYALVSRRKKI